MLQIFGEQKAIVCGELREQMTGTMSSIGSYLHNTGKYDRFGLIGIQTGDIDELVFSHSDFLPSIEDEDNIGREQLYEHSVFWGNILIVDHVGQIAKELNPNEIDISGTLSLHPGEEIPVEFTVGKMGMVRRGTGSSSQHYYQFLVPIIHEPLSSIFESLNERYTIAKELLQMTPWFDLELDKLRQIRRQVGLESSEVDPISRRIVLSE